MRILPFEDLTYHSVLPPEGIKDLLTSNITNVGEHGIIREQRKFSGQLDGNNFKIWNSTTFPKMVLANGTIEQDNTQSKLTLQIRGSKLFYGGLTFWIIASLLLFSLSDSSELPSTFGLNLYLEGLIFGTIIYLAQYNWKAIRLKRTIRKTLMIKR